MARPVDPEARLDLVGDRREDVERHRLVRLVLERLDGPAGVPRGLGLLPRRRRPGRRAGPPEEPDDRAVARIAPAARPAPRGSRCRTASRGARGAGRPSRRRPAGSSPPRRRRRGPSPGRRRRRCARSGPTAGRAPSTGWRSTSAAQASSTVAPSARSTVHLARPGQLALDGEQADADGRSRDQPRQVATSSPSPSGRIVAVKRGSARTAASKRAERRACCASSGVDRAGARTSGRSTGRCRRATRASGARRRLERLEVGAVLGLERVDEGEVERAGERRVAGGEGLERRAVDDRDPLVGDARLAPPAAGQVGPFAVRDRSSRSSRRPAGRGPSTASSSRTRSRPRRCGAARRRAPTRTRPVSRSTIGMPSGSAAASIAASAAGTGRAERLDPVEVRRVRDPGPIVLAHARFLLRPFRPAVRRRNTGRRRGSCRPRSSRR